jgi:hypothetical protein
LGESIKTKKPRVVSESIKKKHEVLTTQKKFTLLDKPFELEDKASRKATGFGTLPRYQNMVQIKSSLNQIREGTAPSSIVPKLSPIEIKEKIFGLADPTFQKVTSSATGDRVPLEPSRYGSLLNSGARVVSPPLNPTFNSRFRLGVNSTGTMSISSRSNNRVAANLEKQLTEQAAVNQGPYMR